MIYKVYLKSKKKYQMVVYYVK